MLSCKELVENSSDYLDKNMTLGRKLQVALHLLICGKCREFVRHMKVSIDMFQNMQEDNTLTDEEADAITRRVLENKS